MPFSGKLRGRLSGDRRLVLLRFGRMPLGLFENGELVPLQGREVFIVLQLGLAVEDGYLQLVQGIPGSGARRLDLAEASLQLTGSTGGRAHTAGNPPG